jgi:hypothetical protein
MEALSSSETSVLQEPHGLTSQKTPFFRLIQSSFLSFCYLTIFFSINTIKHWMVSSWIGKPLKYYGNGTIELLSSHFFNVWRKPMKIHIQYRWCPTKISTELLMNVKNISSGPMCAVFYTISYLSLLLLSPHWKFSFDRRTGHMGFVVDRVSWWQDFTEYFTFPCQFSSTNCFTSIYHLSLVPHNLDNHYN